MQHRKDQLTCVGQFFEDVHDLGAVSAGQPTGGFVEEQHLRLAKQFKSDVQPLPLAARNDLVKNRSDAQITCLPESQFLEDLIHPRQLVGFGQMRQAEPGVECKILAHCKLLHKHIFLGDMANESGHAFRRGVDVHIHQLDGAKRGTHAAIQNAEQGGFT